MSAPRIYLDRSHLSTKNYQYWWKFDEVLTKTNLLSFFWGHGVNAEISHAMYSYTLNTERDSNFFKFELQMLCVINCKKINKCIGNQQCITVFKAFFRLFHTCDHFQGLPRP